ncbi:MAG: hypothetical protein IJL39_00830 [Clostridia bacterium]|jgi:hypothetical protein|nr:hypothetical protein [Clostridia bacterium]
MKQPLPDVCCIYTKDEVRLTERIEASFRLFLLHSLEAPVQSEEEELP